MLSSRSLCTASRSSRLRVRLFSARTKTRRHEDTKNAFVKKPLHCFAFFAASREIFSVRTKTLRHEEHLVQDPSRSSRLRVSFFCSHEDTKARRTLGSRSFAFFAAWREFFLFTRRHEDTKNAFVKKPLHCFAFFAASREISVRTKTRRHEEHLLQNPSRSSRLRVRHLRTTRTHRICVPHRTSPPRSPSGSYPAARASATDSIPRPAS